MPDYTGEEEQPDDDILTRLRKLAVRMLELDNALEESEAAQRKLQAMRDHCANELIPRLMKDAGLDKIRITGGAEIVMEKKIRCSLSQDRRDTWMEYLTRTGNDGLVLREITVQFGRDKTPHFLALTEHLQEIGVHQDAAVTQKETINAQTLLAFLRREVRERPEVLEAFGAFEQTYAKIQVSK